MHDLPQRRDRRQSESEALNANMRLVIEKVRNRG